MTIIRPSLFWALSHPAWLLCGYLSRVSLFGGFVEKNSFTFEDHLNIGTKEFLLECCMRIVRASSLSHIDALNLTTSVLRSGIIEARNQLAIKIQELNECEDVLRFYTASWDSGDEAKDYFNKKVTRYSIQRKL
jgi:hypothetical protein